VAPVGHASSLAHHTDTGQGRWASRLGPSAVVHVPGANVCT